MSNEELITICSELLDQLTVIKGYLQLNNFNKKIDYSIFVFQELEQFQKKIEYIVDVVKNHD